ncbi:MAG: acyl-CoA dehydrogenase [Myxococcales bacterium]|nr:acyl-CoA dehydrogenase [Myxococcales bacterium]MBK7194515.1 acyl-CoA dehydrogenase [Myxococcales bacterium]MBP6847474.1 acyl-CoA dehydrogenase [Kofleriaceae bacterium]
MTAASHYLPNLRDVFFNLFEVLGIDRGVLGAGPFASFDADAARASLEGLAEFCTTTWSRSFVEGDQEGVRFDGAGGVTLPKGFTAALEAYYRDGWNKLELPEHLGGYGAPPSVAWAAFELLSGANPALTFYLLGNFHAKVVDELGTPDQKARYLQNILDKHWGGTMVLTEPDAGSDVGAGTTKAIHVGGDEYHLEGVKRFITNGDFDQPANIVHLVLARPEGAPPGTKGLGMFLVPKFWVEADGSLGARNGAFVTNVEHKMGIKGSATCELTLGATGTPCRGLLVGGVRDGIAQMFHVIEYARMGVATKSMAALSTGYGNALAYTRLRKQGADLARAADKTAPRVEIIRHPDVRRMLMLQKAFAEGLRALILYTAHVQDQVVIAGGYGSDAAKALDARNDLLLPLCKGYASEKVFELLGVSLQCFGGSGYCSDYPIEQYIRDQKIDTLYEGTTHIQALDLFFRKVGRDRGATLQALMGDVGKDLAALPPELASEAAALKRAIDDVGAIFMGMMGKLGQSPYHVGLHGNRILFALAELIIGWRLLVNAKVALAAQAGAAERDRPFYAGKIAAARFYAREVLPGITASRKIIEGGDLALMELSDDAW